jgi:hypothetical protein
MRTLFRILVGFTIAAILFGCESQATKQAKALRAHQTAVLQQARADSLLARAHTDSATLYRLRQHALSPTSAADTAALRRFYADWFHW